jgi:toxin ParE1/3/4
VITYRLIFSPEAEAQLVALYRYIGDQASPAVAQPFVDAIVDYCEGLTTFPHRGTQRDDLRRGLRTLGFRRRVTLAFSVDENTVTIVGVFYGGQNFESDLHPDEP